MDNLTDRELLPKLLRQEPYTAAVADALRQIALGALAAVLSGGEQMTPKTASWGLTEWERMTGLTPAAGASLEARRAAVVARLTSRGTANAEAIERLAQSTTGYGARVAEQPEKYRFTLELLQAGGGFAALDMDAFLQALEQIKPAHLQFVLPGVCWQDIEDNEMTWIDVEDTFESFAALESAIPLKEP